VNLFGSHVCCASPVDLLHFAPVNLENFKERINAEKYYTSSIDALHKDFSGSKDRGVECNDRNGSDLKVAVFVPTFFILFVLACLGAIGFIRYRNLYKKSIEELDLIQGRFLDDVNALKDKEVLTKILEVEEKNVLVGKIIAKLNKIKDKQPEAYQGWMTLAVSEVEKYKVGDLWKVFEHHFVALHPNFKKDLSSRFPDLTPNEYKVCALIRVNFKTKDISEIIEVSVKSIEAIRTRLRKKFDLSSNDVLLGDYLNQFD
jgi:DNA-binding CsgD family transcriptional regulator